MRKIEYISWTKRDEKKHATSTQVVPASTLPCNITPRPERRPSGVTARAACPAPPRPSVALYLASAPIRQSLAGRAFFSRWPGRAPGIRNRRHSRLVHERRCTGARAAWDAVEGCRGRARCQGTGRGRRSGAAARTWTGRRCGLCVRLWGLNSYNSFLSTAGARQLPVAWAAAASVTADVTSRRFTFLRSASAALWANVGAVGAARRFAAPRVATLRLARLAVATLAVPSPPLSPSLVLRPSFLASPLHLCAALIAMYSARIYLAKGRGSSLGFLRRFLWTSAPREESRPYPPSQLQFSETPARPSPAQSLFMAPRCAAPPSLCDASPPARPPDMGRAATRSLHACSKNPLPGHSSELPLPALAAPVASKVPGIAAPRAGTPPAAAAASFPGSSPLRHATPAERASARPRTQGAAAGGSSPTIKRGRESLVSTAYIGARRSGDAPLTQARQNAVKG
ncbi:Protein of unknown function [Gryllus bimaculatus]|nr:Protein of unknown function [Gryllus bimaculatus]